MQFNHSYYNTLDRGYYIPPAEASPQDLRVTPDTEAQEAIGKLGPEKIGFGSNPFQHPIQGIQARIKEGVGYIDIPFFGAGKGNKERYTPESISQKERRDIKALAEMNKVKLSTHASTNIQGLAGLGKDGFNEEQREQTLKEIKKAIDFASDVQGGAIVFHTGEFPRPFSEQKWNKDKMFLHYPEEENQAVLHMVDDRTGEMVGTVRKSVVVHEPIWKTAEKEYVDKHGNHVIQGDFIDLDGNYLDTTKAEERLRRVAVFDNDREEFKTVQLKWDDFQKRAELSGRTPEEEYMESRMQEQMLRAQGGSLYYSQRYESTLAKREALKKALDFYEKLEENIPEEEKWKLLKEHNPGIYGSLQGIVPNETKMPSEMLKEELVEVERSLKHVHEASSAQDVEARNVADRLKHIKPIAEYGIKKSADTVARAAEYAWRRNEARQLKEENERPVYISPESYLPSYYGSHPDEIKTLIDESRNRMVEILKAKGMSEDKAKKISQDHIKGTVDTGHFNMWRQHWKPKEGQSPEQADKEFNKWYLDKVGGLIKSGRIGQVHITDNMGFDDEHLTPGEGNVPMKEVMQLVEDADIKDLIVEAGSFNALTVVPDTFKFFGSPVYNIARGPSFKQFHETQFGYDAPPFYTVGAYAPSNEWKLWSEVQLE